MMRRLPLRHRTLIAVVAVVAALGGSAVAAHAAWSQAEAAAFTRYQNAGQRLTKADAADLTAVRDHRNAQTAAAALTTTVTAITTRGDGLLTGLTELRDAAATLDTAAKPDLPRPTITPQQTPNTGTAADTGRRRLDTATRQLATHTVKTTQATTAINTATGNVKARVADIAKTLDTVAGTVSTAHTGASGTALTALHDAAARGRDADDPGVLVAFLDAVDGVVASEVAAPPVADPQSGTPQPQPQRPAGAGGSPTARRDSPATPAVPPPAPHAPSTPGGPPPQPPADDGAPEDHVQRGGPGVYTPGCDGAPVYTQSTSRGGVVVINVPYPYDYTVSRDGDEWVVAVSACF